MAEVSDEGKTREDGAREMIKRIGGRIGKDGRIEGFYERWDIRELEKGVGFYWFDTIVPVPIDLKELVLLLPTPVISPN